MFQRARTLIQSYFLIEKKEWMKIALLTVCFALVIASYSIVKELKDSIFISMVGKEYIPLAKALTLIFLVPAVLFYSRLVDRVRRYQLLTIYSCIYIALGLVSLYVIGHPYLGVANTDTGPYRVFGWIFYFLIEAFSPFMVGVFWAFANSVNNPSEAKRHYAFMVSGSKIGGMLSTGFAWWFFSFRDSAGCSLYSDVTNHQIILLIFCLSIALIPVVIHYLIKKVPGYQMHGYEAVYQFEKEKEKEKAADKKPERWGMFTGLWMLFQKPYVFGIFGMLFFYEMVQTVLSYQRLGIAKGASTDLTGVSCFLFKLAFIQHLVGFVISGIGTQKLLSRLGERKCLLLVPISSGILLTAYLFFYGDTALTITLVILRSLNYAFAQPIRESLYIPTIKDLKFKSKSWIDSFGSKLAKGAGSGFNFMGDLVGPTLFFPANAAFFGIIVGLWSVTAALLGKRYVKAIENNEVIG